MKRNIRYWTDTFAEVYYVIFMLNGLTIREVVDFLGSNEGSKELLHPYRLDDGWVNHDCVAKYDRD
ncbi:hypothetical protein EXW50_16295 [Bacillus mycoides]|uniref:hypothetical protein n=1 Tax=Bacillus mycoides TaxID=1405 RepID=UPI001C034262|nr:hypothetical protein [Bacillus mycoides]QWG56869.1 hypothetical protein EXW26_16290 [Bacillus mycoides]QWG75353.1 hypothetical protein EXW63_25745 [Bacillus mycoides]QWH23877.1 hypothetical protein EXW50_16295 [Bacillus mycoides]